MMKCLVNRCLSQETMMDYLRAKVEATEAELGELKA